jgi:putative ABC transport system permease protein
MREVSKPLSPIDVLAGVLERTNLTSFTLVSIILMVIKRAVNNLGLVSSTALGLLVTVTLVTSIPLYSEGMSELLLHKQLKAPSDQVQPKSSLLFRQFDERARRPAVTTAGSQSGASGQSSSDQSGSRAPAGAAPPPAATGISTTLEQYRTADEFLRKHGPDLIGLPLKMLVRYAQTDTMPVLTRGDETSLTSREFINFMFIAWISDFEKKIDIIEGRLPNPVASGELEAVISTQGLDELGILVGDQILGVFESPTGYKAIPIRVVGRWVPKDPEETYWFYQLDYFNNALMVPEQTYFDNLLVNWEGSGHEYTWFLLFDGDRINSGNVAQVLSGITELSTRMSTLLRNVKLEISPEGLLQDYLRKVFFLQILLFVLSAPIITIVLYYIVIAANMVVDKQRNEIAVLKSRGASTLQIVGIYLTEGLLIGGLALIIGPVLGMALAQLIGKTYSFLYFASRDTLPVRISPNTMMFGMAAVALSVAASLIPAIGAARHSIVTYKQEVARAARPPFWQRYFLDLGVLAVAVYGYYLLTQRKSVLTLGQAGDVFSDPLLLLVPAIFMFAISLTFLRFFAPLVELLSRVGSRLAGVAVLLGLRQIARMPLHYTRLVFLLILTLALGSFSASVAKTLDLNYADKVYYDIGSDLYLAESGEYNEETEEWSFPPFEEHLNAPGVLAAARVGRFQGFHSLAARGQRGEVKVLGVDPWDFVKVAYWRPDFSAASLGELMNALASDEQGIIVSPKFLSNYKLRLGDHFVVTIKQKQLDFTIVGTADYFPTLYPDTDTYFIVNLDYIYDNVGISPYDAWLKTDAKADPEKIVSYLRENDFRISRYRDARKTILEQQGEATRTGIFGILSVGFLISTLLTVLGFMLYSFLSFQRRLQQLGILRAMGLSIKQLAGLFLFEQNFLIVLGVVLGTALGVATGKLFIPFLQIKSQAHAGIPPFVILTAWDEIIKMYVILAVFLALALPVNIWLLARMKIHEAVKFGEETG